MRIRFTDEGKEIIPMKNIMIKIIVTFVYAAVLALCPQSLRADSYLINIDPRAIVLASQQDAGPTHVFLISQNTGTADTPAAPEDAAIPDENEEAESPQIADPLAPFNKAMFTFNDRLYFWVMKPVAQGYSYVLPQLVRTSFRNVYDNMKAPGRAINNALQLRFKRSGVELVRFVFNSVVGVAGVYDASSKFLNLAKQDADFGQTLGRYGVGNGFYLVLPFLGPYSARDAVGYAGDVMLHPMTYVSYYYLTFLEATGLYVHDKVNDTSLRIGDYESFKQAAIDPYIALRDAYAQYRHKIVEDAKSKDLTAQVEGETSESKKGKGP